MGGPSSYLRSLLTLVLLGLFLWQTIMAAVKFFRGEVTIMFDVDYPAEQVFPAVTICPGNLTRPDSDAGRAWDHIFSAPFSLAVPRGFLYGYSHGLNQNM